MACPLVRLIRNRANRRVSIKEANAFAKLAFTMNFLSIPAIDGNRHRDSGVRFRIIQGVKNRFMLTGERRIFRLVLCDHHLVHILKNAQQSRGRADLLLCQRRKQLVVPFYSMAQARFYRTLQRLCDRETCRPPRNGPGHDLPMPVGYTSMLTMSRVLKSLAIREMAVHVSSRRRLRPTAFAARDSVPTVTQSFSGSSSLSSCDRLVRMRRAISDLDIP